MLSSKMLKLAGGSSAIRQMFEEGNRLAAQYGRENVYDFSLGNPNFPAPALFNNAVREVLSDTDPCYVHGYMPNSGYPAVRLAVAESLNSRFGTSFGADNIIMTVGAAGGMNVILKTLLNPGDEVLTFAPYFLEYNNYVGNFDGKLIAVPANTVDFQPDVEKMESLITDKTKAVIINSPNNPTGVIYSEKTIMRIAAALERKQKELGISIYIISDEPYRELAYDGAEVPYLTKYYRNTIVGYSWSKSLSLPGERIGYIVLPSELDEYQLIFDCCVIANRILGFVNAPSLMQLAAARCLEETTDISAYDKNRKILYNGLTECGFECIYPQGAFYMWVKAPGGDDASFVAELKKENILTVAGSAFACPGYIRIAYCVSYEQIERSLPAFRRAAESMGLK